MPYVNRDEHGNIVSFCLRRQRDHHQEFVLDDNADLLEFMGKIEEEKKNTVVVDFGDLFERVQRLERKLSRLER